MNVFGANANPVANDESREEPRRQIEAWTAGIPGPGIGFRRHGPGTTPMPEITDLDDLTKTPHAEVFDKRQPRTVRLQLDADQRVPPHRHPGTDIVLYLVSGRLELALDDETYDVTPGDAVRFSGDREIAPLALEPSTAIVVFAPSHEADG